jgi:hypothetical protein
MLFNNTYSKLLEKYIENIIGIYIEGIGAGVAQADTGNTGYNVIHGVIQNMENGRVTFKTINNQTVTRPVVEFITAVSGSSNEEQRPVVGLTIMVNGMTHQNVPFSLSDRTENSYSILLGKPFLKEITSFVKI